MNIFVSRKEPKLDLHKVLPADLQKDDVVFACIGSDLSIGDSLGPLVGTELEKLGYKVIGTLKNPLHGVNLADRLAAELTGDEKIVIAIDACIGEKKSVGWYEVKNGPIHPGKGLGKNLMKVGDYSIAGIVSAASPFEFFNGQTIRLSFIIDMVEEIVTGIHTFFTEAKNE